MIASSMLIVGTRQHFGVAGCMLDGLASAGEHVRFLEVAPSWSRGVANRMVERVCRSQSPRVHLVNLWALRLARRAEIRTGLVTNGRELSPETVEEVREALEARGGGIACYLCDDPFNPVHTSRSWLKSLRQYSVVVSTKRRVMADLEHLGCRAVRYARFGYHPPIHRPVESAQTAFRRFDVAFAGNADQDRLPILEALVLGDAELSIGLFGNGWGAHPLLSRVAQPAVTGLAYAEAMCAATVCPCLVRRANRDGHVMRSIELPAMGAFMLAERTDEHQEMFEQGVHCEYWSSHEELVAKARWFARHPSAARAIAKRGHALVTSGGFTYAERAREVMGMIPR